VRKQFKLLLEFRVYLEFISPPPLSLSLSSSCVPNEIVKSKNYYYAITYVIKKYMDKNESKNMDVTKKVINSYCISSDKRIRCAAE